MTTPGSVNPVADPAQRLWVHCGAVVARHHTRYPAAPGTAVQRIVVSGLTAPSMVTPVGTAGAEASAAMETMSSRATWPR